MTKQLNCYTDDDFLNYDFTSSKLLECSINNKKQPYNRYRTLLNEIYNYIDDKNFIFENTTMKKIKGYYTDKGFTYYNNFDFSIQGADSNNTIKEIINIHKMVNKKLNKKIDVKMIIELKDKNKVEY